MKKYTDLRSDTVTRPGEAMRKAMYEAEVGDDVFKEDPTVNRLEEYAAELLGKEAALFVSSGVMGNQICLNYLTNPGDEVICERDSHIFNYESGSPAALSGIQLMVIDGKKGVMKLEDVEAAVRPVSAYYMPRTKVIEVENTHNRAGGIIQPLDNIKALKEIAEKYDLRMHLDGARLWNASIASGIRLADWTKYFDTVSCCMSKGLGAPVGSLVAGSKDFIKEAFRIRKGWGGGMRQVGILAAAGLYALQNNINRLEEDHRRARRLAEYIASNPAFYVDLDSVQTNIVIFEPKTMSPAQLIAAAKEEGVLFSVGKTNSLRAIAHLDISDHDIDRAISVLTKITGSK
ncbi:MAG: DegT/DnrJ/EryC1/StrS family aminotransferase [Ignavibacteriaceae bacterium]|nr:DegT/DnrJ/EryC1/StrS family aminotransferase [Ignavibacteriaceae bacterium]